jgi:hypothetical protein
MGWDASGNCSLLVIASAEIGSATGASEGLAPRNFAELFCDTTGRANSRLQATPNLAGQRLSASELCYLELLPIVKPDSPAAEQFTDWLAKSRKTVANWPAKTSKLVSRSVTGSGAKRPFVQSCGPQIRFTIDV